MESPVGHVEDFCLYPKAFGKQRSFKWCDAMIRFSF